MIDAVGNWLTPMWVSANQPAPTVACCHLGCATDYIFCSECGEKVYRVTHKTAPLFVSEEFLETVGFSHIGESVEYSHDCRRNKL
jgi:hypothetical protein